MLQYFNSIKYQYSSKIVIFFLVVLSILVGSSCHIRLKKLSKIGIIIFICILHLGVKPME